MKRAAVLGAGLVLGLGLLGGIVSRDRHRQRADPSAGSSRAAPGAEPREQAPPVAAEQAASGSIGALLSAGDIVRVRRSSLGWVDAEAGRLLSAASGRGDEAAVRGLIASGRAVVWAEGSRGKIVEAGPLCCRLWLLDLSGEPMAGRGPAWIAREHIERAGE